MRLETAVVGARKTPTAMAFVMTPMLASEKPMNAASAMGRGRSMNAAAFPFQRATAIVMARPMRTAMACVTTKTPASANWTPLGSAMERAKPMRMATASATMTEGTIVMAPTMLVGCATAPARCTTADVRTSQKGSATAPAICLTVRATVRPSWRTPMVTASTIPCSIPAWINPTCLITERNTRRSPSETSAGSNPTSTPWPIATATSSTTSRMRRHGVKHHRGRIATMTTTRPMAPRTGPFTIGP